MTSSAASHFPFSSMVNLFRASCYSLEIVAKDGEELLLDNTSFSDIFQNTGHMPRLGKDISNSWEVPSSDRCLTLNVHLSLGELIDPLLKALNTLIYVLDRFIGLFFKDCSNINLIADLLANFSRNSLQNVFKLVFIVIYMPRNGPNELETIK